MLLAGGVASAFLPSPVALVQSMTPAVAINNLAQTLLRTTLPGVPDLYRGTDLWDINLVDPDNRRPIDYTARHRALWVLQAHAGNSLIPLFAHWTDGRTKQAVLARALVLHAALPVVFESGDYRPPAMTGSDTQHVLMFARTHGADAIVVIVPLYASAVLGHTATSTFTDGAWWDTTVSLPSALSYTPPHSAFDGALPLQGPRLALGQVLTSLPVALPHT